MRITIRHKFYSKQAEKKKKNAPSSCVALGLFTVYQTLIYKHRWLSSLFLSWIESRREEKKNIYEKLCTFSRGCFTVCQQKGAKGLLKKTHTVFIRRHIHRDSINEWLGHVQRFTCPCFAINKVCVMWGAVPLPLLLVLWIMQRRMWK